MKDAGKASEMKIYPPYGTIAKAKSSGVPSNADIAILSNTASLVRGFSSE
jgi:hypothetical protein